MLAACLYQDRTGPLQPVMMHSESLSQLPGNEQDVKARDLYVQLGTSSLYLLLTCAAVRFFKAGKIVWDRGCAALSSPNLTTNKNARNVQQHTEDELRCAVLQGRAPGPPQGAAAAAWALLRH